MLWLFLARCQSAELRGLGAGGGDDWVWLGGCVGGRGCGCGVSRFSGGDVSGLVLLRFFGIYSVLADGWTV